MQNAHAKASKQGSSTQLMFLATALIGSLLIFSTPLAGVAQAATISFSPSNIAVTAAPGEEVAIPLDIALSDTSRNDAYASFRILQTFGNLNRTWVSGVDNVLLNATQPVSKNTLRVKVPAGTPKGEFYSKFRTVWLKSNEAVAPIELTLNLNVEDKPLCEKPTVHSVSAAQSIIKAKNNQTYAINFTGQIDTTDGCPIERAWYNLSDEYAEYEKDEAPVSVNPDGSFSASVKVLASRNGEDKDGRTYTVVFGAENAAGENEGDATSIVIAHDNRK